MIPKFRAWDKRSKEMWKVSTLYIEDEYVTLFKKNIYENPFDDDPWAKFEDVVLMQSTGLKDKNGVDIFEGDIVQWGDTPDWEEEPIRVAVVKINPDIQFDSNVGIFQYGQFAYQDTERFLTILGNIYTNPELLEVSE